MTLSPDLLKLVGTWKGRGRGEYPTIETFDYLEEVTFSTIEGKPFLVYRQATKHAEHGGPLHTEAGYVRSTGPGTVELTVSQPTGIIEAHSGTLVDGVYTFTSDAVVTTPTAVDVSAVERTLTVSDDELSYHMHMAAVEQPMTLHLTATLHRVDPTT